MSEENDKDLDMTEKLFAFLQGELPEGCTIAPTDQPKLTADQAWCVIWWLGNQYWQVTDRVERCCVCGELYHTWQEGACLDYGRAPYSFCDNCREGDEFAKKARSRLNPDKQLRAEYLNK